MSSTTSLALPLAIAVALVCAAVPALAQDPPVAESGEGYEHKMTGRAMTNQDW